MRNTGRNILTLMRWALIEATALRSRCNPAPAGGACVKTGGDACIAAQRFPCPVTCATSQEPMIAERTGAIAAAIVAVNDNDPGDVGVAASAVAPDDDEKTVISNTAATIRRIP